MDLIRNHRAKIYSIVAHGSTLPTHIKKYLSVHENIIATLQAGEAEKAGIMMKAHVMMAGHLLSGTIAPLPWFA